MTGILPKKILLVDDEEILLNILKKVLESSYDVITTTRGKEAIRLAKDLRPDLIILDILLPDIRGEDVKRILQDSDITANIPIIYLTGRIDKEDEDILRKVTGKFSMLAKPIEIDQLLVAIKEALSN